MSTDLALFDHVFIDNQQSQTCFLLHGTGGSKTDLLFLNEALRDRYNLVGLQGNVTEQGQARFFKRFSLGIFDQESIRTESEKLFQFVTEWMDTHALTFEQSSLLGYSNGANLGLATLLSYSPLFYKSVLLHPMLPFAVQPGSRDLSAQKIFVSEGTHDPFISASEQQSLIEAVRSCRAVLTVAEYSGGHAVSPREIQAATTFLKE